MVPKASAMPSTISHCVVSRLISDCKLAATDSVGVMETGMKPVERTLR